MASTQPSLTLIVAATAKNGIGKNGGLPWPMLKKEMAYFARVTKRLSQHLQNQTDSSRPAQNVVIMGRKTWDSIPPKFRPLKDRTNLIISSQSADSLSGANHEDVLVATSIEAGIKDLLARSQEGKFKPVGKVFVIGGAGIYDAALKMEQARHVLLTRIRNDYECDTVFPTDLDESGTNNWVKKSHADLEGFVGESLEDAEVEEEAGGQTVRYRFCLYERK